MPKGKTGVMATGRFDQPYRRPENMPWDDIQRTVGKTFSEQDRKEIHRCAFFYFSWHSMVQDAGPVKEVGELRRKLLEHTDGLLNLAERYRPGGAIARSDEDESVFMSLAHALEVDEHDPSLTTALCTAAAACQSLHDLLLKANIQDNVTSQTPEAVGLAHFVAEALKGATQQRARASRGYSTTPTAIEYHRWGLRLSAQTGDLPALSSAVLRRSVTQTQTQHAFEVARQLGLIS